MIDTSLGKKVEQIRQHLYTEQSKDSSPPPSAGCKTNILFLVLHGGNPLRLPLFVWDFTYKSDTMPSKLANEMKSWYASISLGNLLDMHIDHVQASKRSDFSTFKMTFEQVMRTHYPGALNHIAFRLVSCPQICTETVNLLAR